MERRVERITLQALGRAAATAAALSWSGTFHAIGARLLRECAPNIGLDKDFTIHDREDSADLMNLVRHELGFSRMEKRFPTKGTCLSIYSRIVNSQEQVAEVLGGIFPWCAEWEPELRKLFAAYVEAKQKQNVLDYDDLLLYWSQIMLEGAIETLLERQKLVAEGAGATGLAAVLAETERFRGRRVGIVITGGNMDSRLLASILMRGLVREGRLVRLRCELPDVPGALSRLSGVIGKHAGNIVEVHHQRLFHDTSVKRAELDVVVETQNRRHVEVLIAALVAAGFPTRLLLSSADDQHAANIG